MAGVHREWVAYWNEIASHIHIRGWFELLFDYTADPAVLSNARIAIGQLLDTKVF